MKQKIPKKNNRSYISNWRELGGGNLVFYPNAKVHPMVSLKKLNKLFEDAGVPQSARCSLAINSLRGAAADWAEIKEHIFITFDDFEGAFKEKYWGVEKQRELYLDISYGRFENGSRAEYFINYITEAKFLSEAIPMQKLIDMLSRHFPAEIKRGIVTNGLSSFDVVEEYLRKIDETYRGEGNSNVRRNINYNNGNYVNPRNRGRDQPITRQNEGSGSVENVRITVFNREPDEMLSDPEEVQEETEMLSPSIELEIGNREVVVLVDSGSDVCAISENFYEEIKNHSNIPVLPVTNSNISVAAGNKTFKIKKQILLPIKIKQMTLDMECFVIPGLNCNILLGANWLTKYKAIADFGKSELNIIINNKPVILKIKYKLKNSEIHINLCQNWDENDTIEKITGATMVRHLYTDDDLHQSARGAGNRSQQLYELLKTYQSVFSETPSCVKNYVHEIVLKEHPNFNVHVYPIPFAFADEVTKQIGEMLRSGFIQPEKTEYVLPLVCTSKKDKSVRVCLDARALNKLMVNDYVVPPNPGELLFTFKKGQIFSTLDLTAAYWQIPVKADHTKYLGFVYKGATYTFQRLPFGLSTSMASLIRCVSQVLGQECLNFAHVYVDDLIIHSDDIEAHFRHLKIVFEKLQNANFSVKLRKSQFLRSEVHFLGHVITSEGIILDPKRIESIKSFPRPRNVRELRGFLGLVNYERRFIEN